ncbi:hypothetical protein AMTRI_Chr04g179870 [Amborella trichopoda]
MRFTIFYSSGSLLRGLHLPHSSTILTTPMYMTVGIAGYTPFIFSIKKLGFPWTSDVKTCGWLYIIKNLSSFELSQWHTLNHMYPFFFRRKIYTFCRSYIGSSKKKIYLTHFYRCGF